MVNRFPHPDPVAAPRPHPHGFTVLEVFLVISLAAALLALLAINFPTLQWDRERRPIRDLAFLAVAEAHQQARTRAAPTYLLFDEESGHLAIHTGDNQPITRLALPADSQASIRFFRILPDPEMNNPPAMEPEEVASDRILFSPQGISAPFIIQVETPSEQWQLVFDPFSSAVLEARTGP